MDSIASDLDDIESKLRGAFIYDAVNQVMNTVAGLSINELRSEDADYKQQCFGYTSGFLFMPGPHNMVIMVGMLMEEAYKLVARISGLEVSQLKESHLFDVVNELANMISGRLKAQLAQKGYIYNTTYPLIVSGEDYLMAHSPKLRHIIKKFKTEALELMVKVIFV